MLTRTLFVNQDTFVNQGAFCSRHLNKSQRHTPYSCPEMKTRKDKHLTVVSFSFKRKKFFVKNEDVTEAVEGNRPLLELLYYQV